MQFGVEDNIDKVALLNKLNVELEKMKSEISRCEKMLNNPNFVNKAPEKKVNEEKEKLANYQDKLEAIQKKIEKL